MSAEKPSAPPAAASKEAAKDPLPEAQKRVGELQTRVTALRQEVAILEGRVQNRNPALVAELQKELGALKTKSPMVASTLWTLVARLQEPTQGDDARLVFDQLKASALAYFATAKIDEAKWKDIVSL